MLTVSVELWGRSNPVSATKQKSWEVFNIKE